MPGVKPIDADAPKDLFYRLHSWRAANELTILLGEPKESGVRMDEWRREVVSDMCRWSASSYYNGTNDEDGKVSLWRVRSPLVKGKHLRVVLLLGSPSGVHFQVVDD